MGGSARPDSAATRRRRSVVDPRRRRRAGSSWRRRGRIGATPRTAHRSEHVFSYHEYHEVWHVGTLTGAAAHVAAVWIIVA